MMLRLPRPAFYDHAACATADLSLFFPAPGRSAAAAKAICADCPVVQECAAMAIADHGLDGVFGGLTVGERDHIRQLQGSAA